MQFAALFGGGTAPQQERAMSDVLYLVLVIFGMAVVTFAIRAVPLFLGERFLREQRWIRDLGEFLPLAIMVLLVLAGLFDVAGEGISTAVAASLSIFLVVLLQWRLKRPLLSIFAGALLFIAFANGWIPAIL